MMSLEKSQGLGHGLNKKQGGQRHLKRGGFQGVMTPALLARLQSVTTPALLAKAFRQVLPADPFLPDDVFTCDAGARGFPRSCLCGSTKAMLVR